METVFYPIVFVALCLLGTFGLSVLLQRAFRPHPAPVPPPAQREYEPYDYRHVQPYGTMAGFPVIVHADGSRHPITDNKAFIWIPKGGHLDVSGFHGRVVDVAFADEEMRVVTSKEEHVIDGQRYSGAYSAVVSVTRYMNTASILLGKVESASAAEFVGKGE